jgi:hypothetical protein
MRYLYIALCSFSISNLSAEAIQYSGVSYTSSNKDIEDMFPYSLSIESSIRKTIFNELTSNNAKNPDLYLGVSESYKDGSYSTVIAIENENISSIKLNNNCLKTFSLGIQIITFNTKDQQIASIIPNAVRRIYYDKPINGSCNNINRKIDLLRFSEIYYGIDITKSDYESYTVLDDEEMIQKIAEQSMNSSSIYKQNQLLGSVINNVLEINLNKVKNTNFFVGIDDVVLDELAQSQLKGDKNFSNNYIFSDFFGDFQTETYKIWAGQQFSKWFSDTFNYPLIPYVKGRALGKDISMKFADGSEALNLKLPSLDFGFVINIKGFKKVKLDESDLRAAYAWAAFSSIEFHNVGIQKITEINLKHVYTEEINKSDTVDDWSNFNLSQNILMRDYIINLDELDKKWLKKAAKIKSKDFKKHAKLILSKAGV